MKICFFSDIHGNVYAFQAFLKDIECKKLDMIIFGGDVLGYYYHADEILTMLRKREIHCLMGNHDQMFLEVVQGTRDEEQLVLKYGNAYSNIVTQIRRENIEFLMKLKPSLEIVVDGCRMGFFHGAPLEPLNMRIYPDTCLEQMNEFEKYDYVFMGHTHHKMLRQRGECILINPGSAGQQRDGKGCSYIVFDTRTRQCELCVFSYDRKKLVEEIMEKESSDEMARRLMEVLFRENAK